MKLTDILHHRLHNQQLAGLRFTGAGALVAWIGALQAQEYPGGKWSIGLRLPAVTDADVEQAIEARTLVRSWPMRGTLHFVAAPAIRWMQSLMAPRVMANAARRRKQLELDDAVCERGAELLVAALRGDVRLTRRQALDVLEQGGIRTANQRGYHLLWWVAHTGVICFGPARGKEPTFVLLDAWLPPAPPLTREESLAEIARIYFRGHGPATLKDLMWWTGLVAADARAAVEMVEPGLHRETFGNVTYWMSADLQSPPSAPRSEGSIHLLPGFDEYLLGYTDRSAMVDPDATKMLHPGGNGVFKPTVLWRGRVIGTWKRTLRKDTAVVTAEGFSGFTKAQAAGVHAAADRYARFIGVERARVTLA